MEKLRKIARVIEHQKISLLEIILIVQKIILSFCTRCLKAVYGQYVA